MKNNGMFAALLVVGTWASLLSTTAADTRKNTMDSESAVRPGKQVRQTSLKGYTVTYHLMDLSERGEMVKMMGHHAVIGMSKSPDVTNHLMVYIEKSDGKAVPGDVAYLLTGPDGKEFRTMAMGMYGGYGADVIMKLKGVYTIRTKIIIEKRDFVNLDDEFKFQMQ